MKVLYLLSLTQKWLLAKSILVCFLSILTPVCLYAYDFEVKFGDYERSLYFNVLSEETGHKTCEITFRSKDVKDGKIVYNAGHGQPMADEWPTSVTYQGEEYLVVGIGDHAFENTNCEWFVCPDSAKYVGTEAFKNCKKLKIFFYNPIMEKIGERAFEDCVNLEHVHAPGYYFVYPIMTERRIYIGSEAFHGCMGLKVFDVNWLLPKQLKVEWNAFDIVDGRINCDLWITPVTELYPEIPFIDFFSTAEPWKFFNIVEDTGDRPTKEEPVICGQDKTNTDVYNLTGQKIGDINSLPQLGHGIYIVNGRKYLK